MKLADIGRALGFGVVHGLGTAEEQRTRQERAIDDALRLRSIVEAERRHQEALAERRRLHDLEWGNASEAELGALAPILKGLGIGAGTMPRKYMGTVIQEALRRPGTLHQGTLPPLQIDPENPERILGQGMAPLTIPGTPAETMPFPATPEEPPADVTVPGTPARKSVGVSDAHYPALLERLRGKRDALRKEGEATQKADQQTRARADFQAGKKWEEVAGKYPLLTAKDYYGYEPANPTSTPAPKEPVSLEAAIIPILKKPASSWTPEEKAIVAEYRAKRDGKAQNPDDTRRKKASADLAELRLSDAKARQASATLLTDLRAGKKHPEAEIRKAIADHQQSADRWLKATELLDDDAPEKAEYRRYAVDARRMAAELQRYLKGPAQPSSGTPSVGGVASRWGIRLPGAR